MVSTAAKVHLQNFWIVLLHWKDAFDEQTPFCRLRKGIFDADRAFCQLWNGALDDHMAFCWPWNGVLGALDSKKASAAPRHLTEILYR